MESNLDIKVLPELNRIFERNNSVLGFNPTKCINDLINWFDTYCQRDRLLDPYDEEKAKYINNLCGWIAKSFFQESFPTASVKVLIYLWNKLSECQRHQSDTGMRIYKAGIAYYLMDFYLVINDIGGAIRWALLCHADDILENHEGSGSHRLLNTLGMTEDAYDALNKVVQNVSEESGNGWSHSSRFPENVLVEFILSNPEYGFWLTQRTSIIEYPISTAYFRAIRAELEQAIDKETDNQGKVFEDLATYLMLLIPNWIPQRNVRPREQAFEHDIIVTNMMSPDNLEVDLYGRDFLIECKYVNRTVSANEVGYFLHRMHLTHTRFGIIFTRDGITGGDEDKYAQNQIYRAYQQDKRICIVIKDLDLDLLEPGNVSFRALLLKKVNELRFGKPQAR